MTGNVALAEALLSLESMDMDANPNPAVSEMKKKPPEESMPYLNTSMERVVPDDVLPSALVIWSATAMRVSVHTWPGTGNVGQVLKTASAPEPAMLKWSAVLADAVTEVASTAPMALTIPPRRITAFILFSK